MDQENSILHFENSLDQLNIHQLDGKLVYTLFESSRQINLNFLSPGAYLIKGYIGKELIADVIIK